LKPLDRRTTLRERAAGWVATGWGLADQALVSVVALLTIVLSARALDGRRFGEFVLVFTALQVANNLQVALFAQPHNILASTRRGSEYVTFTSSTFFAQLAFAGLLALVGLGAAGVAAVAVPRLSGLLLAGAAAAAAWQVLEFTRRVLYTEGRVGTALAVDAVGYGGQAVALTGLYALGRLDGTSALLSLALAMALGATVGVWLLRGALDATVDRSALHETWKLGRWLAGSRVGLWLTSYLHLYLSAVLVGVAAPGQLRAAQTLLAPLNVPLLYLDVILPIRLARALERLGLPGERAVLRRTHLLAGPPLLTYCIVVALLAGPLLDLVFGPGLSEPSLVWLFAAYYALSYVALVSTAALAARRRTRTVFVTNAVAALPGALVGLVLMPTIGVAGAVIGMVVTSVVLNVGLGRALRARGPGSPDELAAEPAPLRRDVLP
jgi:O-antigen/teichoic acid export membrane protein